MKKFSLHIKSFIFTILLLTGIYFMLIGINFLIHTFFFVATIFLIVFGIAFLGFIYALCYEHLKEKQDTKQIYDHWKDQQDAKNK